LVHHSIRWNVKIPTRRANPGDRYRTVSRCGGGYGDPLERDPLRVLEDVLDEYVSLQSARSQYGVVVDATTLTVDQAATQALRQHMRAQGGQTEVRH
jgi:N-methylhydantoinase B/oxoprolinase/acetone carboxylase alpha subunit